MNANETLRTFLESWKPAVGKVTDIRIVEEHDEEGKYFVFTVDVDVEGKTIPITSSFYEEVVFMPATEGAIHHSFDQVLEES